MVVVSISETYDLSTKVNKMTLIGIHTPKVELIKKTYPGLCMNFKYFRVLKVDCLLATAQRLPLSVGEIGLDGNKIRPQDMMNPILYKACSNDSWSTLEARIMGLINGSSTVDPAIEGNMADVEDDKVTGIDDEHPVYYSLLADRDGFRTTSLQEGVQMRGLVPLVFDKWYNHGENVEYYDTAPGISYTSDGVRKVDIAARGFRGRPHPMPKMNTTYLTGLSLAEGGQYNGMGDGLPTNNQKDMPNLPPVMLGGIVLPPASATTGIMYYRMVCRAYIEFSDVRPIQDISSFASLGVSYSGLVYHTDYEEQSKSMDALTDMVDVKNADIEKIMEGR